MKREENRKKEENGRKGGNEMKTSRNDVPVEKERVKKSSARLSNREATQRQRSEKMRAMRNIGDNNFHPRLVHCTYIFLQSVSCLGVGHTVRKSN